MLISFFSGRDIFGELLEQLAIYVRNFYKGRKSSSEGIVWTLKKKRADTSERNEKFFKECAKVISRFTAEFTKDYCD